MSIWKNEAEAREQIKALVADYYHDFKEKKEPYKDGDRITYAARVFDEKEMQALTDATLDFWLTTGRFADQFEKQFAEWIGVKFAHLVNSGSSANLIAFMTLTAPELGDRQIKKGDEIITVACLICNRSNICLIRECVCCRSFCSNCCVRTIAELSSPYRHIRSSKHCNYKRHT